MKKILLIALASIGIINVHGQSSKVVSAHNYLSDFKKSKDAESLVKAKEFIDLASNNPDTKDLAKTQVCRGQIYFNIFDNNLRLQTEKNMTSIADPKKREAEAYQNTSAADLDSAYQAFAKAKSVDLKGNYRTEIGDGMASVAVYYNNKAAYDYNGKKFAESFQSFEKAYEIGGYKDTNLLYNCALTAERSEQYDKAKTYYQKMIDGKHGQANAYSMLVNVYLMAKDTVVGMDLLKKARVAYPNDINLLISETNYFLKINNSKEALINLNLAIVAKPTDANLYLVRGNIYDNLGNPKDNAEKDMEKPKDYDEKLKLAEADYKKAVELKPDYFDAMYNLGVLYNNHGVAITKESDKITDNAKFAAENLKATDEFSKAMPILEKALEINPKDKGTMIALKQIYARMQMLDKLKIINEKLKN